MEKRVSGPFGSYTRECAGYILNALCALGVPINIVGDIRIGDPRGLLLHSEIFADYKYFPGIEQPLFRFHNKAFGQQRFIRLEDNSIKPNFHLSLGKNGVASLNIDEHSVTSELHAFLCGMFTNRVKDPRYDLHHKAGAFFKGDPGETLTIEFWKPSGAEAFVDYVNDHFVQPVAIEN